MKTKSKRKAKKNWQVILGYHSAGYEIDPKCKAVHREVFAKTWPIPNLWHVHHIDGNRANNDISNLMAMPGAVHRIIHKKKIQTRREVVLEILNWFKTENGEQSLKHKKVHQFRKKLKALARRKGFFHNDNDSAIKKVTVTETKHVFLPRTILRKKSHV